MVNIIKEDLDIEEALKKKFDRSYYYYGCNECKNNIKEEFIEESILDLLGDIFEYDPEKLEEQHKQVEVNKIRFNLFNKREIEKTTKNINNKMDDAAEEFYKTKKDKEKDDGLSL